MVLLDRLLQDLALVAALETVKAAVLVTDLEGVVIFANPFCEVLYGSPPEAMAMAS